jgi:hypothetical protein
MKFFCLFLLSACLQQSVKAQLTGHVEYPNLGISFQLPFDWYGQENESSIIATTPQHNCVLVISVHKSSLGDLEKELRTGIHDDMGTSLALATDEILKKDKKISGALHGVVEYNSAECYYVGLENKTGFGLSVLGVSFLGEDLDLIYSAVDSLVKSVKFSSIKSVAGGNKVREEKESNNEMSVEKWIGLLGDSLLTNNDTSNSTDPSNEREKLYLCRPGYFRFEGKSTISIGGDAGSANLNQKEKGEGSWGIIEQAPGVFTLKLNFYNGTYSAYAIAYIEEKLYLNKIRYFLTSKGDFAPNCE